MRGQVIPGLLALAMLVPAASAAAPAAPGPGRVAAPVLPVLLVCDPDGCRHRFNALRARPHWNAYRARQARAPVPAALPFHR